MRDVATVVWKEWQEYLQHDGGHRLGPWRGLLLIAVGGGFIGWQVDPDFGRSVVTLLLTVALAVMLVSTVIPDAFAGERERHTLESLLASRLPDRALLLGKVAAAVSFGWLVACAVMGVGIASANLIHGRGGLPWAAPEVVSASLALSLIGAVLMAALGVHVSLYAPTARQAHQRLGLLILALLMVPAALTSLLPGSARTWLFDLAVDVGLVRLAAAALLLALLAAAVLLALAMLRFHRARMIA